MMPAEVNRAKALKEAKLKLVQTAENEIVETLGRLWKEGSPLTNDITEAIEDVVEAHAKEALAYAASFYDEAVGHKPEIALSSFYNREWTAQSVQSAFVEDKLTSLDWIMKRLTDHAGRIINRAAGNYVIRAAKHSELSESVKVRFAWVPANGETCMDCLMLGSHGWVSWSKEIANEFNHYHADCNCVVVASKEDCPVLADYDPDGIRYRIKQCQGTIERILNQIQGPHRDKKVRFAILQEMAERDPEWIRTGKVPAIEFENSDLETDIRENRPHEIATATRLSEWGVPCRFVVDYQREIRDGIEYTVGLADLDGGKEIKSLREARSFNTICRYLRNTKKKRNARYLYFDNFENDNLSDKTLIKYIIKCRRFRGGHIYVYGHDGQLHKVR